jgi:uncharacterized oligopeptide transporter (OPT) family protein
LDPERRWLAEVYQPGARQLTLRAILAGMAIGALMCLSNLYVVLKTGWSLGVTVTACILAWGAFRLLRLVGIGRSDFGMLENNAMGSVASAAGYMTGGGNMAAVPALLILTGIRPEPVPLILWFAVVAAMGVFVAVPIKRQLVNLEQLPFPTGTATAETIRALHAHGGAGREQARLLGLAGLAGGAVAWLKDGRASWMRWNLPEAVGLPFTVGGLPAGRWTLSVETSLLLFGGGALMSFRTGWSMLLGALLTYGVIAPAMVARGVIETVSYRAIVQWMLWGGASVLVSSGILTFAFQWRSVARSFAELRRLLSPGRGTSSGDPLAGIECPPHWFPLGLAALGPAMVFLMAWLFRIPWWAGLLAVPLAVVMGFVAARVTGETDTTPTKALGPVTQLVYGGLLPGNVVANVMSANATGGVGLHAADLLTDLKSGFLLGANPRQQLYAQLFGVLAGAAAVVPAYNLLVPDASLLGSQAFPAPSVQVWAGVSRVLASGMAALHPTARAAILAGAAVGCALALAERLAPARLRPFVPSPAGLGIAMVIPGHNAIAMFLGAGVAAALRRWRPALAARAVTPVGSGFIAGESLMGIVIALLAASGGAGR